MGNEAVIWCTDSRIEPIAVGERQWRENRSSPLIEIGRREGVVVAPPPTVRCEK